MSTEKPRGRGSAEVRELRADSAAPASVLESLQEDFEAFGLSGYEARVLLALLQLGSAPASELARVAGLGRTNVYPTIDALQAKGLADAVPGKTGVWSAPDREEAIGRLYRREEQRLRELQLRRERARDNLNLLGPPRSTVPVPYVHSIRGADDTKACYGRLLATARSEVLVFNRPPYSWSPEHVNSAVGDTLARGVRIRVLYQAAQLAEPAAQAFRAAHEAYHAAGVEPRVVDELPIKLAVADQARVLLAMADPISPEIGFPTNLLVEHPGFAGFAVAAFEQLWASATRYEQFVESVHPLGRRRTKAPSS